MLLTNFSKQFSKNSTSGTLTSNTGKIYRSWFSSLVVKIVNVTLDLVRYYLIADVVENTEENPSIHLV